MFFDSVSTRGEMVEMGDQQGGVFLSSFATSRKLER